MFSRFLYFYIRLLSICVQCDRQQAHQNSEKCFRGILEQKYIEGIETVIENMNHYCENRNRVKIT